MKQIPLDVLIERFEKTVLPKTRKEGSCLLYTGTGYSSGYGLIQILGRHITTHRLAYAYYNNTNDLQGLYVLHSCDTPNCIAKEHLRLGTARDNYQDMLDRDRCFKGLSREAVTDIYSSGKTSLELANLYNVTTNCINAIRAGKSWSNITDNLESVVPNGLIRRRTMRTTLTEQDVIDLYYSTETLTDLAKQYNTDASSISKIKNKKSWLDVTKGLGVAGRSTTKHKAKLDETIVAKIYTSKESSQVLAKLFSITSRTVQQIRTKETWKVFTDTLD